MSTRDPSEREQDRRRSYLAVARRLFAERGFDATSTDMIVAEVGGSKATLYKYFPTKEALVAGLITEVIDGAQRAQGGLAADALAALPLRDALTRIGRATLDAVVSAPAIGMLRLCLGEVNRFPDLARALWDHGPARSYAVFRAFLEDRRDRGELDVDDLQLASEHFLAAIAGHIQLKVAMRIAEPPPPRERDQRVAAAVATFLAR
ncbi:MAG: TetR/AcrR family transcriptional regulator, partial [Myxococcales bacterium]|nr:TetR/AcrR family transcriptional regulator [Myxococcales bacterium]